MAEDLLEDGVNPELIELGNEIIKAQQIEIDAMKALL
jgi:uncharacterized protein (DUF305 family)